MACVLWIAITVGAHLGNRSPPLGRMGYMSSATVCRTISWGWRRVVYFVLDRHCIETLLWMNCRMRLVPRSPPKKLRTFASDSLWGCRQRFTARPFPRGMCMLFFMFGATNRCHVQQGVGGCGSGERMEDREWLVVTSQQRRANQCATQRIARTIVERLRDRNG